jgi:transposase
MHPYRCRNDHSGRRHPQGCPCRRSTRLTRQTPGYSEHPDETPEGYKELVDWARGFGPLEHARVEGTGSFGAGLARFLKNRGIKVFEVIRPKRSHQYRSGKSDPIDAESAARSVLADTAIGEPKEAPMAR